ncbi:ubiquinol-cytochrome c reductase iron-sulfur subunit [Deinococcus pimensis]|uniref:ubiquinol-cytochrome c reductase iron-sulfur subunit n=1 Tax=Deinococcus pimensis TaxID=309888 RepID=UPI0004877071|nr:Rieske 2Fe-2S domain-containing protein [Deinococcus pimensis]
MTKFSSVDPDLDRRRFVHAALGVTVGVSGLSFLTIIGSARPVTRETPDRLPPTSGDVLVHAEGDQTGMPVDPGTLTPQPTRAYPQGVVAGQPVVKSGDPDNLLLISRFPVAALRPPTDLQAAPEGIVVYSAACQHLGCPVGWKNQDETYLCPCHSGNYDPKRGCTVIGGPPPRPLPQLPVTLRGGQLIATATFLTPPYGVSDQDFDTYIRRSEMTEKP